MKNNTILALILSCAALAACVVKQNVVPVSAAPQSEICIIEHPATRASFLAEYRRLLTDRGFAVRMLPAGSTLTSCALTTTYVARWS